MTSTPGQYNMDCSACRAGLWAEVQHACKVTGEGKEILSRRDAQLLERLSHGRRWSDALPRARRRQVEALYRARLASPGHVHFCAPDQEIGNNAALVQRDIKRTFSAFGVAPPTATSLEESLRRVLVIGAECVQGGYCQGMGMLAASLLLHVGTEARVFALFESMMNDAHMAVLFERKCGALSELCRAFDGLLCALRPSLHSKLSEWGVDVMLFCIKWFSSLFAVGPASPHDVAEAEARAEISGKGSDEEGEVEGKGASSISAAEALRVGSVGCALLDLVFGSCVPADTQNGARHQPVGGDQQEQGQTLSRRTATTEPAGADGQCLWTGLDGDWLLRIALALITAMEPALMQATSADELLETFESVCKSCTTTRAQLVAVLVQAFSIRLDYSTDAGICEACESVHVPVRDDTDDETGAQMADTTMAAPRKPPQTPSFSRQSPHPHTFSFLATLDREFLGQAFEQRAACYRRGVFNMVHFRDPIIGGLFFRAHAWTLCPSVVECIAEGDIAGVIEWQNELCAQLGQQMAGVHHDDINSGDEDDGSDGSGCRSTVGGSAENFAAATLRYVCNEIVHHVCYHGAQAERLLPWLALAADPATSTDAEDVFGLRPLHTCALLNRPRMTRLLVRLGANAEGGAGNGPAIALLLPLLTDPVAMHLQRAVSASCRRYDSVHPVSLAYLRVVRSSPTDAREPATATALVLDCRVCIECGRLMNGRAKAVETAFCSTKCRTAAAQVLHAATTSEHQAPVSRSLTCTGNGTTIGWWHPHWVSDNHGWYCSSCLMLFNISLWRRHCNYCGCVFCSECLKHHLLGKSIKRQKATWIATTEEASAFSFHSVHNRRVEIE